MGQRNNIVSKLMEKVPARYKEGGLIGTKEGAYVIFEIRDLTIIVNYFKNHRVFGHISTMERDMAIDTMLDHCKVVFHPNGIETFMVKLKIEPRPGMVGKYVTSLASLAVRESSMYVIVKDGKIEGSQGGGSFTMARQQAFEMMDDITALVCELPENLPAEDFDYAKHGVFVQY